MIIINVKIQKSAPLLLSREFLSLQYFHKPNRNVSENYRSNITKYSPPNVIVCSDFIMLTVIVVMVSSVADLLRLFFIFLGAIAIVFSLPLSRCLLLYLTMRFRPYPIACMPCVWHTLVAHSYSCWNMLGHFLWTKTCVLGVRHTAEPMFLCSA